MTATVSAATAVAAAEAPAAAVTGTPKQRIIKLSNGKTCTFASNESTTAESIPLIDVARMYSDDLEERKALAEEIRAASRDIGFFLIVNHGIDLNLAADVLQQAKHFFGLPLEEKMKVCTDLIPEEFCGYHPQEKYNWEGSKLKDLHEAYNWNYDASKDPDAADPTLPSINLWPENQEDFRTKLCTYQSSLTSLARRLTRIFALALHLPENAFDEYVKTPEAGMRILKYPKQETSRDDQTGIGSHTDVECFTIITLDQPGLEVLNKAGRWIKVLPVQDSFVVNIADCFMRQTNDFFVSTVHRVINESGAERYSAPFFWGFNRDTVLNPIPTCVSEENPNKYPVMTAGEYYAWRTARQKEMGKEGGY